MTDNFTPGAICFIGVAALAWSFGRFWGVFP